MNLLKKILSLGLSINLFVSGCSGLERKIKTISRETEFEAAALRDGLSEDEWRYQILLYSYKLDSNYSWKSPKRMIKEKAGVCASFASLSAFYSGARYGNNILILAGTSKESKEAVFHAVHLLEENGKFGSRGYHGDNFPVEYSLKQLINGIQGRHDITDYKLFWTVNLDNMNQDWRTMESDLNPDYLRVLKERKAEMQSISDLK